MHVSEKLTGIYWDTGAPTLHASPDVVIPLQTGTRLDLAYDGLRSCIGIYQEQTGRRISCSQQQALPPRGGGTCNQCSLAAGSFAARTGQARTDADRTLLQQEHIVYLALFGSELVKVGVSRWGRSAIRLHEQGATAALAIARCNGTDARDIEQRIHTESGIPEVVRTADKLRVVAKTLGPDDAKKQLLNERARIADVISPTGADPYFRYFFTDYGIDVGTIPSVLHSVEYANGGHIAGKVAGILGTNALVATDNQILVLPGRTLEGLHYTSLHTGPQASKIDHSQANTHAVPVDQQGELF